MYDDDLLKLRTEVQSIRTTLLNLQVPQDLSLEPFVSIREQNAVRADALATQAAEFKDEAVKNADYMYAVFGRELRSYVGTLVKVLDSRATPERLAARIKKYAGREVPVLKE